MWLWAGGARSKVVASLTASGPSVTTNWPFTLTGQQKWPPTATNGTDDGSKPSFSVVRLLLLLIKRCQNVPDQFLGRACRNFWAAGDWQAGRSVSQTLSKADGDAGPKNNQATFGIRVSGLRMRKKNECGFFLDPGSSWLLYIQPWYIQLVKGVVTART